LRLTWHIVAKDLRRLRLPLAAWVLLMVAKIAFFARIAGIFGAPDIRWLQRMDNGPMLLLRTAVEPLIAYVLVGWLVFEDPLVERDPFWVTRPISGGRLLGAKVLAALGLFVLLPALVNVPWWLACGFGLREIADAALQLGAEYLIVTVVGLGCAAATNGFPRYVLWTFAGLAAVAAVHFVIGLGFGARLGPTTFQDVGMGLPATRMAIFALCLLAIASELVCYQYLRRHFRRSLVVLIAGTALASAFACASTGNLLRELARRGPGNRPGDERFQVRLAGTPVFDHDMELPLAVEGVADNTVALWQMDAEWTAGGARVWKTHGWSGDFMVATRALLDLPGRSGHPRMQTPYLSFPALLAQRMAIAPLAFHATLYVQLLEGQVLAELPPRAQTRRYPGGSFSIGDLVAGDHGRSSMVVVERTPALTAPVLMGAEWPPTNRWILVNHRTARMSSEAGEDDLVSWSLQLNAVRVACGRLSFAMPADAGWPAGWTLAVVRLVHGHDLVRTLDIDPFNFRIQGAGR
jgi:hypothetical protein